MEKRDILIIRIEALLEELKEAQQGLITENGILIMNILDAPENILQHVHRHLRDYVKYINKARMSVEQLQDFLAPFHWRN